MKQILLGCDPEAFLYDTAKGKFIGANGVVPGTKYEPAPLKDGMVQVDGLAIEFGIRPAASREEWLYNLNSVQSEINAMLPKNVEIRYQSTAVFDQDELDIQPPECLQFGCNPEWNAITGRRLPPPRVPRHLPRGFRSAGGHIHVGWTSNVFDKMNPEFMELCSRFIKQFTEDVPKYLVQAEGCQRFHLYGRAGNFRPTSYGVEWRTPSNFWVASQDTQGLIYDEVIKSAKKLGL